VDVAGDARAVYVATPLGVDVFPAGSYAPAERLELPGNPRELLLDGDSLWVAAGRGGLLRIDRPLEPDERTITIWSVPGDVRSLVRQDRWLWVAVRQGRLLALPADADADTDARSLTVDGWPADLAPWGDGVLIAARAGGLLAAQIGPDGAPVSVDPPVEQRYASTVLPVGDDLYVNTFSGLVRQSTTSGEVVEATQRAKALAPFGDGVLAAVGKEGLLLWDGTTPEVAATPLLLPGVDHPVAATDITALTDDLAVVTADEMGVFWLRLTAQGWEIEGRHRYLGRCEALEHVDGRIAAGLTGSENASVLFLDRQASGDLADVNRIEVPLDINGMVQVGRELVVAGVGAHVLDLDHPERGLVDTKLVDGTLEGLELLPSGRVVGLQKEQSVTWFARSDDGTWGVEARSLIGTEFIPMNVTSLGERVGIAYGGYGRLKIFDEPGAPPTHIVLLSGGSMRRDGPYMRPANSASALGKFWITVPGIGIEGIDPDTLETTLLRAPFGVTDVHPYGDLLAVALGHGGAALLDPARPDDPVVAHTPLPGDTRVILVDGDQLIAATGGTLFVLETGPAGLDEGPQ